MYLFRKMSINISRTSSNVNQFAKRVNSTSFIGENYIDDLRKLLEKQV